jgi:hypothetical protein
LAAEQRTSILRLLGIDVWVQRQAATEAVAAQPVAEERDPARLTRELRESLQESPRRSARADSGSAAVSTATPVVPQTNASPAVSKAADNDFPACRVVALHRSEGLLLADGADLTLARRLGRDLMASHAGGWKDRPSETLFDWQPEKVSGVSLSGRRALGAFINKQLDDLESGAVVLACTGVLELLPELPESAGNRGLRLCKTVSLTELATDTAAKRVLWTQIQQLVD